MTVYLAKLLSVIKELCKCAFAGHGSEHAGFAYIEWSNFLLLEEAEHTLVNV
jgi:hypothetical protein